MESRDKPNIYLFNPISSVRKGFTRVLAERGPLLSFLTLIQFLVGAGFLWAWSQQERFWHLGLGLGLGLILWAAWHYLRLVVEVRASKESIAFRRFTKFDSIPWERVSRVGVYSMRTTGNTYIILRGQSFLPLAILPLWIPWWWPEPSQEVHHLVEDLSKRVPVKHTQ